jgi:hypothetical protein
VISDSLNRKSKPRYLGPFNILRKIKRGAYVLQELDGTPLRSNIAAFRLAPYIAQDKEALTKIAKYNLEGASTESSESSPERGASSRYRGKTKHSPGKRML